MRKLMVLAVAAAVAFGGGIASAADPIVIKFSHVVADKTPKGYGALLFNPHFPSNTLISLSCS